MLRRIALLLLLVPVQLAQAAGAGIKEYEVIGKAQARAGKGADKSAEDDALRLAVETGVKELIGEIKPEQQPVIAAKILKNSRRYVPEFRVVDRTEAGATVLLKLKAKVALDTLRADLVSAGVIATDKPQTVFTRVIVLPAPSKTGAAPWWAAGGAANAPEPHTHVLVEALRAKGFQVTEPRRPEPDPDATATPAPAPSPEMTNANLIAVARSHDADVLVKTPWDVQVQMRPLDGVAYALARAKIGPVEAIAVKDGAVVATASGEGVAGEAIDIAKAKGPIPADVSTRIQDLALRNAANDVALKLSAALGDPIAKGGRAATIRLVVAGLDSFVAFTRFESALGTELKSVRGATLRSIERGEAVFEISLDRGVDALGFADEIGKKSFDDFSVKVTEKSAERVVVHVVR